MNEPLPILDIDFGISQLSGNKALFVSLLKRFMSDYSGTPEQLREKIMSHQLDQAKIQIHTLKGVASNLGLKALQATCKSSEQAFKDSQCAIEATEQIIEMFEQSRAEIRRVIDQHDADAARNHTLPDEHGHVATLIDKLTKNEFVAPQYVNLATSELNLSPADKSRLAQAINELEYATALDILKQH